MLPWASMLEKTATALLVAGAVTAREGLAAAGKAGSGDLVKLER